MLQIDFSTFPEVNTARLLLRKISSKDAQEILHLRSDEHVMQYIAKEKAATIEDAEVFINRIVQALESNDGITWAITLKENPDTLIGTIGYWRLIKEHHRAEIGYMLNPAYWKQGIMQEALREVIEVGFNALKLHSIEANIHPENIASANILISTGFLKEAFFRENFFYNGTFKDTEVYSRFQK
ncbi:MAG: GNAT family N-acetyltransferase [Ferruginibacter sp.]